MRNSMAFSRSSTFNKKAGVFQPVTGQAIVVQTTAADDEWAEMAYKLDNDGTKNKERLKVPEKELVSRVESHTIAFKKKHSRRRNRRGAACDLPVFSALNGMTKKEILTEIEAVGIVQTPVNPNDKTKPAGFRTNATRIGGTVSLINTGDKPIPANVPVVWDVPFPTVEDGKYRETVTESECGGIKGHPEGIIYPATRAYTETDIGERLLETVQRHLECVTTPDSTMKFLSEARKNDNDKTKIYEDVPPSAGGAFYNTNEEFSGAQFQRKMRDPDGLQELKKRLEGVLLERQRIIGWSLNYSTPGEQLDLILKK